MTERLAPALSAAAAPPAARPRLSGGLAATVLLVLQALRGLLLASSTALAFVVVTAFLGGWIAETGQLVLTGLAVVVLLPLLSLLWLRRRLRRRLGRPVRLGGRWFVVGLQLVLVAALALGFSQSCGRVLRRRGDWFLGTAQGWLPRQLRRGLQRAAGWLERFDAPAELGLAALTPVTAPGSGSGAGRPSPPFVGGSPRDPTPPRDAAPPPPAPPPTATGWFHPLALVEGERLLPPNASCRFGAHRADVRRTECELGHCGVDLFAAVGTPIYAATAGRVLRVERDETRGGRAGRYLILTHRGGAVRSYYVHVDRIAEGLRAGDEVSAGQQVATLGRTGIKRSAAHLHFGVELRRRGRWRYIDPEPLLWTWQLPGSGPARVALHAPDTL